MQIDGVDMAMRVLVFFFFGVAPVHFYRYIGPLLLASKV
jgi:hypothetical protein